MSSKCLCLAASILLAATVLPAKIVVKNNDRIAFLGDSITAQGSQYAGGFANLVIDALSLNNIKTVKLPAGRNGQRAPQLLARLEKDVIAKKPQILVLSCGINDVSAGKYATRLAVFKHAMRSIVEKAQAAGIKVCILTATMIRENANHKLNKTLKAYNDSLIELAEEKKCMLADVNYEMQQLITYYRGQTPQPKGNLMTYDGIHLNARGNVMIAQAILRAFGLTEEEIKKAEKVWSGKLAPVSTDPIKLKAWERLSVKAAQKHMTIQNYIMFLIKQDAAQQ